MHARAVAKKIAVVRRLIGQLDLPVDGCPEDFEQVQVEVESIRRQVTEKTGDIVVAVCDGMCKQPEEVQKVA